MVRRVCAVTHNKSPSLLRNGLRILELETSLPLKKQESWVGLCTSPRNYLSNIGITLLAWVVLGGLGGNGAESGSKGCKSGVEFEVQCSGCCFAGLGVAMAGCVRWRLGACCLRICSFTGEGWPHVACSQTRPMFVSYGLVGAALSAP